MTKAGITALTAAAALALSASAHANDTDYCVDYEYLYEDTDYYDDKLVSKSEFTEIGKKWFDEWDADNSGYVDEAEFTRCYDSVGWDVGDGVDVYTSMDLSEDDYLDEEEFFNEDAYDRWDLDNNDEIQAGEWM